MSVVEDFLEHAKAIRCYAFDIEHNPSIGLHQQGFDLWGCSFSTDKYTFYAKNRDTVRRITDELFPIKEIEAIAYNGKYDIQCLKQSGWANLYPETLVDPMIALNLLDDNKMPNQLGLKENVWEIFAHRMMTFEQAIGFGPDSQQFTQYACEDSLWEFRIWQRLKPELEHQKLLKYFQHIPALKFFADVETCGVKWDLKNARKLMREYIKVRDELEEDIYKEIGILNLDSPKQLRERLFVDLGYATHGLKQTPGGDISTDADAMEMLAKRYPICSKIVKYRTASKLLGTYVVPLSHYALESSDQRIHPSYWLVSATGRTRCDKPNLQNIPAHLSQDFKHLDIRQMFIPREGYKFCVFDLSQIELRLVAHYSKDPMFLRAYRDWECTACATRGSDAMKILHKCPKCGASENEAILKDKTVAGFWHGLDLHTITAEKVGALHGNRQAGKTSNFALVYCASATRMNMEAPEFSIQQWQDVIDDYFEVYTGVRHWHRYMEGVLQSQHETRDIFGRKRRIPPFLIKKSFKHALNQIVNFPPQASACGMMQLSCSKMRKVLMDGGYWLNTVFPLGMIHDEVDLEIREDKVGEVIPIVQECFERIVSLEVPVRVGIGVGENWKNAK